MIRIALSSETRKALAQRLQQAYATSASRLIRRIHALFWLAEGKSVGQIAQILDVGEQTVRDWLHAFLLRGLESLHYRPPKGRPAKLTSSQRSQLKQLVLAGPEASGYQSACWTSAMIADLIHLRFGVSYHPRYVCHLLSALGLSYQKAKFTSDHLADHEAILWLEETWPEIVKLAQERHGLIVFGDEASFAQWGSLNYTWALKGCQPVVPTSGIRKAHRVFGLFAPFHGWLLTKATSAKFNSESYEAFLAEVLSLIDGFIILVQDNAPYHTSGRVQDFIREHRARLAVYQLPPYSPDLNPIERRPNRCRASLQERQEPGGYNGLAPRPPALWADGLGSAAVSPAWRAAVGDRVAGRRPAVRPRLLVYASCAACKGPEPIGRRYGRVAILWEHNLTSEPDRAA